MSRASFRPGSSSATANCPQPWFKPVRGSRMRPQSARLGSSSSARKGSVGCSGMRRCSVSSALEVRCFRVRSSSVMRPTVRRWGSTRKGRRCKPRFRFRRAKTWRTRNESDSETGLTREPVRPGGSKNPETSGGGRGRRRVVSVGRDDQGERRSTLGNTWSGVRGLAFHLVDDGVDADVAIRAQVLFQLQTFKQRVDVHVGNVGARFAGEQLDQ